MNRLAGYPAIGMIIGCIIGIGQLRKSGRCLPFHRKLPRPKTPHQQVVVGFLRRTSPQLQQTRLGAPGKNSEDQRASRAQDRALHPSDLASRCHGFATISCATDHPSKHLKIRARLPAIKSRPGKSEMVRPSNPFLALSFSTLLDMVLPGVFDGQSVLAGIAQRSASLI